MFDVSHNVLNGTPVEPRISRPKLSPVALNPNAHRSYSGQCDRYSLND